MLQFGYDKSAALLGVSSTTSGQKMRRNGNRGSHPLRNGFGITTKAGRAESCRYCTTTFTEQVAGTPRGPASTRAVIV